MDVVVSDLLTQDGAALSVVTLVARARGHSQTPLTLFLLPAAVSPSPSAASSPATAATELLPTMEQQACFYAHQSLR